MGCRRFDLGRLADRGSPRCWHHAVALYTRHALRGLALHLARHLAQRLPAAESRDRPAAKDKRGNVNQSTDRTAPASLLEGERVARAVRSALNTPWKRSEADGLLSPWRGDRNSTGRGKRGRN